MRLKKFSFLINKNRSARLEKIYLALENLVLLFQRKTVLAKYFIYYKEIEIYLNEHTRVNQFNSLEKNIINSIEHESIHHALNYINEKWNTETNTYYIQTVINNEK